jgi:hypothetical protein
MVIPNTTSRVCVEYRIGIETHGADKMADDMRTSYWPEEASVRGGQISMRGSFIRFSRRIDRWVLVAPPIMIAPVAKRREVKFEPRTLAKLEAKGFLNVCDRVVLVAQENFAANAKYVTRVRGRLLAAVEIVACSTTEPGGPRSLIFYIDISGEERVIFWVVIDAPEDDPDPDVSDGLNPDGDPARADGLAVRLAIRRLNALAAARRNVLRAAVARARQGRQFHAGPGMVRLARTCSRKAANFGGALVVGALFFRRALSRAQVGNLGVPYFEKARRRARRELTSRLKPRRALIDVLLYLVPFRADRRVNRRTCL